MMFALITAVEEDTALAMIKKKMKIAAHTAIVPKT